VYWVIDLRGNIYKYIATGRCSQILDSIVIWGYFFRCDTRYDTDQTAVAILTSAVQLLSADDGREGIKCSARVIDGRKGGRYSVVYISPQINMLCYAVQ